MSNNRDIPSTKKKHTHRRMVSLPSFETILAKSKLLLSTTPPEISPIPESPSEESNHVKLISSISISPDTQRSNSFPSDLTDTNDNNETRPSSDSANSTLFVVTSPSFNSDLSSEQNDDVNQLDSSSVSYLQSKQRRIDHRRNRSEPVKSQSTEDLSSNSVINNDSSNNNTPTEIRKKSTAVTTPSSSLSSRKKKAWYNVSRKLSFLILLVGY
ncbi:unnamed protein product [Adineta ricciae]|uniref:Uncharacterized protein n=1 Tax=Adineta ricciae TaxID=249248 RepID=A0A816DQR8_ADIRI|nr:unnamed protein product [Adineta ricciae]